MPPLPFTQHAVTRVVKGAEAAGKNVESLVVDYRTGTIRLQFNKDSAGEQLRFSHDPCDLY